MFWNLGYDNIQNPTYISFYNIFQMLGPPRQQRTLAFIIFVFVTLVRNMLPEAERNVLHDRLPTTYVMRFLRSHWLKRNIEDNDLKSFFHWLEVTLTMSKCHISNTSVQHIYQSIIILLLGFLFSLALIQWPLILQKK